VISFFEDFVAREVAPMVAATRALTQAERDELAGRLARLEAEYADLMRRAKALIEPWSDINNGHWDVAAGKLEEGARLLRAARDKAGQVEALERSLGRARLGRFH
jgi:hypothetical protein